MEFKWEGLITLVIVLFIALLVYSKMKHESLKEAFDEIKELIVPVENPIGVK